MVQTAPAAPKTEITAEGQGATMVISPAADNKVSGTITLRLAEVSADAR